MARADCWLPAVATHYAVCAGLFLCFWSSFFVSPDLTFFTSRRGFSGGPSAALFGCGGFAAFSLGVEMYMRSLGPFKPDDGEI